MGAIIVPLSREEEMRRSFRRCLTADCSGAELHFDGRYRWTLWRVWEPANAATFIVIGLNPSTADATQDDPTIRRCINFAKREGCGRLVMLNLFGFRATDPTQIPAFDPGESTNIWVLKAIFEAARADRFFENGTSKVVAAWGAHKYASNKAGLAQPLFPGMLCFGHTKSGAPKHPLYLKADTPLVGL